MKSIIRAWKDPVYRAKLSATDQEQVRLSHPAGMIELAGTDLDAVAGGGGKSCSGKSHGSKSRSKSGKSKSGKSSRSRSGKSSASGKY